MRVVYQLRWLCGRCVLGRRERLWGGTWGVRVGNYDGMAKGKGMSSYPYLAVSQVLGGTCSPYKCT